MSQLRSIIAAAALLSACGPSTTIDASSSRAECAELRAHLAELGLARPVDHRDPAEIDVRRSELIASMGDAFVDTCTRDGSRAYVQCALESTSRGELTRCP